MQDLLFSWKKSRAWLTTILVNALIIAFSSASEGVLSVTGSLGSDQFIDSIVGTFAAVIVALAVIAVLAKPDLKMLLRKGQGEFLGSTEKSGFSERP